MTRIGLAAALLLAAVAAVAQSAVGSRSVYVTALGRDGVPVPGLTEADLSIREDGRSRPVLSVAPATSRLSIVMLITTEGWA